MIRDAEIVLRQCGALCSGLPIPLHGLRVVARHSLAVMVRHTEIILRLCIALLGLDLQSIKALGNNVSDKHGGT